MSEACDPKPMAEWIAEPDPKVCRPCMISGPLGVVVRWYRDELNTQGAPEHAAALEKLVETTNADDPASVLTMCQELDKIKATVDIPLRERLTDFDCAIQSYQPAAEAQPNQQQTEKQ